MYNNQEVEIQEDLKLTMKGRKVTVYTIVKLLEQLDCNEHNYIKKVCDMLQAKDNL